MKLYVFDLDGTLAKLGKKISNKVISGLKKLEKEGNYIAVCSGKPTFYLSGIMRQIGLKKPIMIGENGADIVIGVKLPPKERYHLDLNEKNLESLKELVVTIKSIFKKGLFFQPNEICLTIFPETKPYFQKIEDLLSKNYEITKYLDIYRHSDSFDIVPKGVNKAAGLLKVCQILGITSEDVVAVGDGNNDIPMFEFAHLSIGVNFQNPNKVTHNFSSIEEVMDFLVNDN